MHELPSIILSSKDIEIPKALIPQLKVVGLPELLEINFPPREFILWPWLATSGLCQIHAFRGIGKTHLSLGIAYAVATGREFLRWKASKPRKVLYIDGEMPAITLQERLSKIVAMNEGIVAENLSIITPDLQQGGVPDLATLEGQQILNQYISEDTELIILDNLSCLVRSGKENTSEDWMPVQDWILKLRAQRKSVIQIHHAGKNGSQRGCSKREDVLDTVISLERPNDYKLQDGARFVVKFEKARGFFGDEAKSFEAHLCEDNNGKLSWKVVEIEEGNYQKVITLFNEGLSQMEIAEELGIHKSNVSRHVKQAKQVGLILIKDEL